MRAELFTLVYNPDTTIEQPEAMVAVGGDRDPHRRVPYLMALAAIEESRPYMTEEVYQAAIENLNILEE